MEIHRLAFGVVAVFGHTAAVRTQLFIGINGALTGNQLDGFAGA